MAITQGQRDWATNLVNDPEVYSDLVEQIVDIKYKDSDVFVIAIDQGNPPVIPLKQIAFRFTYADDTYQELLSYEFKLLNADEVDAGDSRPAQFAAHMPLDIWTEIQGAAFWEAEACDGGACEC